MEADMRYEAGWCQRAAFGVALPLAIAFSPKAEATPITYAFSVTATSGSLNGAMAAGTFSYDTSSIIPGGVNANSGLLTALNFTWDGITYDQTTANTGNLAFDSSGTLVGAIFGTNCSAGGCSVQVGLEQWSAGFPGVGFSYAVRGGDAEGGGTVTLSLISGVPEPSSLALLGVAIFTLILTGAARQRGGIGWFGGHSEPCRPPEPK
jgi:hypothetical protein